MFDRIFLTLMIIITMVTRFMAPLIQTAAFVPVYLELPAQLESLPLSYPTETPQNPEPPIEPPTQPGIIAITPSGITTTPSGITTTPPGITTTPPGITTTPPGITTTPPGITIPGTSTPSAIKEGCTVPPVEGPLVTQLPKLNPTDATYQSFKTDVEAIVNKAKKNSGIKETYGLFIMNLTNEYYYGLNDNLTQWDQKDKVPEGFFNSASVIKLFQGYLFCDLMRRGELDTEKTYYDKVTGRRFKLLPMIQSMISYSDNNYSNACLRLVDNKKSNEVLARLGIVNSRLYGEMSGAIGYSRENNVARYGTDKRCARLTPSDAGLILYNIYKNKDSDVYMKTLNEALLGNIYNTRIPVGVHKVSAKYAVAHKTGTNSSLGVYNDAGIIYTPSPYILVAFTQGVTSNQGHTFIRSLAEQLTRYFGK